jgi:3-oxoacyl-[acyl-carrier-protein] synthase III
MAKKSIIESLGVYVPKGRLSSKEIMDGCIVKPAIDLQDITGIKTRGVVAENEYVIDLSREAVAKCFEVSKYSPEDIDMVICANISRYSGPKYKATFEPSTAAQLAKCFDFGNAKCFDMPNACAGMFTLATVLDAYIKAGIIKRGLAVSGESLTCLTRNAQKEMRSSIDPQFASLTVGDAGAAFILDGTDDTDVGFHQMEVFTVAEHCELCMAKFSREEHGGFVMFADSARIHEVCLAIASEHVGRTVKDTEWENGENHHFIMHQTATKAISTQGKLINQWVGKNVCTRENSIVNVVERGNTASTAHFVALWDHILNGTIKSGENILFAVQASGVNLGVALYTLDDLPDRVLAAENSIEYAQAVSA